jgi:hypothetical protein
MNACPGCQERIAPGEDECSHCGTPLNPGGSSAARPVLAGRKTFIAGAVKDEAVPGDSEELYVPRHRAARPLDPKDPFATAVREGGGGEAGSVEPEAPDSTVPPSPPASAKKPRSRTEFWSSEDPSAKPTLVGEPGTPGHSSEEADPWAEAIAEAPIGRPSLADVPDALVGVLVSYSSRSAGTVYPLRRGRTSIGRSGDPGLNIGLNDGKVSSPHCMIVARPSGIFLQDSASTNGTQFRRGEDGEFCDIQVSMNNSARLEDGDFLRVGDSVFLVRLFDPSLVQRIWGS